VPTSGSRPAGWETYYGGPARGQLAYGLPELAGARERLAGARRIAQPRLLRHRRDPRLAPLLAPGWWSRRRGRRRRIRHSGAGRSVRADLMGSEVMGSLRAYKAVACTSTRRRWSRP
jgi:N-acetyl-gamma-glutamyl-phosphate reductase